MATPTMKHQVPLPGGAVANKLTARLRVIATDDLSDGFGHVTASNLSIGGARTFRYDGDGVVNLGALHPTSGSSGDVIDSPTGCVYELVTTWADGRSVTVFFTVPDTAGTYWVHDYLADPPSAVTAQLGHNSLTGRSSTEAHPATSVTDRAGTVSAALAVARLSQWWLFGHSYGWLIGVDPSEMSVQRIAEQVGAVFRNHSVSGSALVADGADNGGFTTLMQELVPPSRTYAGAAGFPAQLGAVSLQWGYNDGVTFGANARPAWAHALRAVLSWCHASCWFQHDASSTGQTKGGSGWSTTSTTDIGPGTSYASTATTGATVTVVTPANAAGQTVGLLFVADYDGGSIPSSSLSFTRDGSAVTPTGYSGGFSTVNAWSSAIAGPGVMVARFAIPNDAATHSFVATAGAGGVAYCGYILEAPRPVFVHDVAQTSGGALNETVRGNLNSDIDTVVAEFDTSLTKVVEMHAALGAASNMFGDTVHPNVRGHHAISEAVHDALVSVLLTDAQAVLV